MNDTLRRTVFSLILMAVLFCAATVCYGETKTGVTSGTGIQLRNAAVNGDIIKRLNSGIRVYITEEKTGADGMTWYGVSSNSPDFSGYLRSDFIRYGRSASEISPGSTFQTAYEDVKIKSGPGDGTSDLCTLKYGTVCTVNSVTYDEEGGYYWFDVDFPQVGSVSRGYIRYDCLNMDDFENELKNMGFPDSYIPYLSGIHDLYPQWNFVAYDPAPGMTFDKCVDVETGISMIQSVDEDRGSLTGAGSEGALKDLKGVETTLNGPVNGAFTLMSVGNIELSLCWTAASKRVVAYYMDPRNFMLSSDGKLNTSFFMFLSGTDSKGTSEAGVKNILSTTSMTGTIPGEGGTYSSLVYGSSVSKGVNPYLVAARMRQEHGNAGGDALINGNDDTYPGYYNYFNIQANGADPVKNGLRYAKEQGWNTRKKSINGGIDYLSENYFLSSRHRQDTLYKQRFFFKNGTYEHQYMTSIYAPHNEAKHVYKGYASGLSQVSQGTFLIPVYDKMPDKPASL